MRESLERAGRARHSKRCRRSRGAHLTRLLPRPRRRRHLAPPADDSPTAVLGEGSHAAQAEPVASAAGSEAGHAPDAGSNHDSAAVPELADSTPEAQAEQPAQASDAAAVPDQPETEAGSAAPAVAESASESPPPRPLRGARSSGHGRSESSRNRGSRNKHAPPPPQEPPKPHAADQLLAQLAYVVVNEAGASVYSTSQVGREELPDSDATLRSGISIGRRLQDPLAELVKIEPQNIGVGLYQHDVNPKHLKETLDSVISSCVNFVGVDLNTASVALLRHVSGLNQLTARRIVEYRKEHGPFTTREQLMQVEGIGPASYTQAAGFLKILEGEQPLDRTWIHPESYPVVFKLAEKLELPLEVVRDKRGCPSCAPSSPRQCYADLARELEIGELTLRDIVDALARPERDPRDDLPKPIFKKGVLKIEDLSAGMELKGTVLNVVDFGAFVDIGLKDSGLVHISQLANRYIKSPHDVVSVGDVVTVWVMGVDQERKRVSLTMVKPGTERQRGAQSGPRRSGDSPRDGRGPNQGRRGPDRPPRPTTSALTSPPVGAPSVAVLAEAPPRRPDRDRGGAAGSRPLGSALARKPRSVTRFRRRLGPARWSSSPIRARARTGPPFLVRPPRPARSLRRAAERERTPRSRGSRTTEPGPRPPPPACPSASSALQRCACRKYSPAHVRPAQATLGGARRRRAGCRRRDGKAHDSPAHRLTAIAASPAARRAPTPPRHAASASRRRIAAPHGFSVTCYL